MRTRIIIPIILAVAALLGGTAAAAQANTPHVYYNGSGVSHVYYNG